MKVKILVGSALLDDHNTAGLYETVDVSDGRGEYLVSIGAAEAVSEPKKAAKKAEADDDNDGPKKAAPARRPAPRTAK
jgi:hypothetical protein